MSTRIEDIIFVQKTAVFLASFGRPDAAVRREDGFAFAYQPGHFVPRIEHDQSPRNESAAIVYTRDVPLGPDEIVRVVVCGTDAEAAGRAEAEMIGQLLRDSALVIRGAHHTIRGREGEVADDE
jgi:hypothetical protein